MQSFFDIRAHSSVRLERTPDKGEVAGSIPAGPTMNILRRALAAIITAAAVAGAVRFKQEPGIEKRTGGWKKISNFGNK